MQYTTEDSCRNTAAVWMTLATSMIAESEAKGHASYDAGAAGCLMDAMEALDCSALASSNSGDMPSVESCGSFITPLVAANGACSADYECTTGYCAGATSSADSTCQVLPGSGQECDDACAAGFYCDFSTSTCLAQKQDGAECMSDHECLNDSCLEESPRTCGVVAMCDGV